MKMPKKIDPEAGTEFRMSQARGRGTTNILAELALIRLELDAKLDKGKGDGAGTNESNSDVLLGLVAAGAKVIIKEIETAMSEVSDQDTFWLYREFQAILALIEKKSISVSEAVFVIQGIEYEIEQAYNVTNTKIGTRDEVETRRAQLPKEAHSALRRLDFFLNNWLFRHIDRLHQSLDLAEKKAELLRLRATNAAIGDIRFSEVLDSLIIGVEKEIEIETERVSNKIKLGIKSGESAVSKRSTEDLDPSKRGLTIDRAIMLFYAIGGSRLKGLDNQSVAKALSYLTGLKEREFVKRFSHVLPHEEKGIKKFNNQTDAYNKDVEVVSRILSEMGLGNEAEKLRSDSGV